MCDMFIVDDRRLISQIKSAWKSLIETVKSLISGKSKDIEKAENA